MVSHFPCGKHREVRQDFPSAFQVNLHKVQSPLTNQGFHNRRARGRFTSSAHHLPPSAVLLFFLEPRVPCLCPGAAEPAQAPAGDLLENAAPCQIALVPFATSPVKEGAA